MEWASILKIIGEVFSFAALVLVYLLGRKQGRAADRQEVIDALKKYEENLLKAREHHDSVDPGDLGRILSGRASSHVSEAAVSEDERGGDPTM